MRCVIKYILKQIWSSEDVTKECSCLKLMQFSLAQANSWSVLQLFKWMNIFLMEVILIVSPQLIAFTWICLPRQGLSLRVSTSYHSTKKREGMCIKNVALLMSKESEPKCHSLMTSNVTKTWWWPQSGFWLCHLNTCCAEQQTAPIWANIFHEIYVGGDFLEDCWSVLFL